MKKLVQIMPIQHLYAVFKVDEIYIINPVIFIGLNDVGGTSTFCLGDNGKHVHCEVHYQYITTFCIPGMYVNTNKGYTKDELLGMGLTEKALKC